MATTAKISLKLENGNYLEIYNHYDGYIQYLGKILKDKYNTYEKVLELVKGGDISSIDLNVSNDVDVKEFYNTYRSEDYEVTKVKYYNEDTPKESPTKRKRKDDYNYYFVDGVWEYDYYIFSLDDYSGLRTL